jgi:hypothetical protein
LNWIELLLFIYSFGVGLESPFCQLQAIYIKLLQVDSTQILYKTHTEHTQTSISKWDSNPRSQCWGILCYFRNVCWKLPLAAGKTEYESYSANAAYRCAWLAWSCSRPALSLISECQETNKVGCASLREGFDGCDRL